MFFFFFFGLQNNHKFFETIFRKKKESDLIQDPSKDQLRRVLGLFDLIALGIGSTLGLGAYVLAGKVAVESAGPAVVLSFVFAAITSALSGKHVTHFYQTMFTYTHDVDTLMISLPVYEYLVNRTDKVLIVAIRIRIGL